MRKLIATLAAAATLALPLTATAAEDLGDGRCLQSDGVEGVWNGTSTDDADCITPAEYQEMYSAETLKDEGSIEDYEVNDDDTTTLDFGNGVTNTVATNPLDRVVAANPDLEPDAPTVRERLEALGLTIE